MQLSKVSAPVAPFLQLPDLLSQPPAPASASSQPMEVYPQTTSAAVCTALVNPSTISASSSLDRSTAKIPVAASAPESEQVPDSHSSKEPLGDATADASSSAIARPQLGATSDRAEAAGSEHADAEIQTGEPIQAVGMDVAVLQKAHDITRSTEPLLASSRSLSSQRHVITDPCIPAVKASEIPSRAEHDKQQGDTAQGQRGNHVEYPPQQSQRAADDGIADQQLTPSSRHEAPLGLPGIKLTRPGAFFAKQRSADLDQEHRLCSLCPDRTPGINGEADAIEDVQRSQDVDAAERPAKRARQKGQDRNPDQHLAPIDKLPVPEGLPGFELPKAKPCHAPPGQVQHHQGCNLLHPGIQMIIMLLLQQSCCLRLRVKFEKEQQEHAEMKTSMEGAMAELYARKQQEIENVKAQADVAVAKARTAGCQRQSASARSILEEQSNAVALADCHQMQQQKQQPLANPNLSPAAGGHLDSLANGIMAAAHGTVSNADIHHQQQQTSMEQSTMATPSAAIVQVVPTNSHGIEPCPAPGPSRRSTEVAALPARPAPRLKGSQANLEADLQRKIKTWLELTACSSKAVSQACISRDRALIEKEAAVQTAAALRSELDGYRAQEHQVLSALHNMVCRLKGTASCREQHGLHADGLPPITAASPSNQLRTTMRQAFQMLGRVLEKAAAKQQDSIAQVSVQKLAMDSAAAQSASTIKQTEKPVATQPDCNKGHEERVTIIASPVAPERCSLSMDVSGPGETPGEEADQGAESLSTVMPQQMAKSTRMHGDEFVPEVQLAEADRGGAHLSKTMSQQATSSTRMQGHWSASQEMQTRTANQRAEALSKMVPQQATVPARMQRDQPAVQNMQTAAADTGAGSCPKVIPLQAAAEASTKGYQPVPEQIKMVAADQEVSSNSEAMLLRSVTQAGMNEAQPSPEEAFQKAAACQQNLAAQVGALPPAMKAAEVHSASIAKQTEILVTPHPDLDRHEEPPIRDLGRHEGPPIRGSHAAPQHVGLQVNMGAPEQMQCEEAAKGAGCLPMTMPRQATIPTRTQGDQPPSEEVQMAQADQGSRSQSRDMPLQSAIEAGMKVDQPAFDEEQMAESDQEARSHPKVRPFQPAAEAGMNGNQPEEDLEEAAGDQQNSASQIATQQLVWEATEVQLANTGKVERPMVTHQDFSRWDAG